MLKYFTLILITTSSILFGQTDSQTDKDAIISLYSKLKRYQDGYFSRPLNQIYGLTTEVINNEYRVTKIDLPSSVNITNGTNVSITQDLVTDLHSDLNQLTEIKEIIISPEARYSSIVNNSNFNQDYKVDFNQLTNLQKLEKFEFDCWSNNFSPNSINLVVENLNYINSLPEFHSLKLSNIKNISNNLTLNNIDDLRLKSGQLNFDYFNTFKSLNTKNLELELLGESMENINFLYSFPLSESITLKGSFNSLNNSLFNNTLKNLTISSDKLDYLNNNINNAINLEKLSIQTSKLTHIPSTINELNYLRELLVSTFATNFNINSNISTLNSLKKLTITSFGYINNLSAINNLINLESLNLNLTNNYSSNVDFQNLSYLNDLSFILMESSNNIEYNLYELPNNIDKLTNLNTLVLSVGESSNIDYSKLTKLTSVQIRYINPYLFPKLNFNNNSQLKKLEFYAVGANPSNDYNHFQTIEFENDYFNNLTNLENLVFWYVPVKMNVTNMFSNNLNLKSLYFDSGSIYSQNSKSEFSGILNLCNNPNVYLSISDNSPLNIDLRNNARSSKYFSLTTRQTSPTIIVDDTQDFISKNGSTFFNYQTNATETYNLLTSTEPCQRNVLATSTITNPISIDIYPNPTTDILYIETNSNENLIKIYNFNGQLIQDFNFNINKGSIMVDNLKQGIYIIEIENQNGKVSKKFMKN